jgi:uncharacterized protein (DUF697 family)
LKKDIPDLIITAAKTINKFNNSFSKPKTKKMKDIDDIKNDSAEMIIKNHMVWSMGAGFIPIPLLDFAAITYIQLDMIRQLAKIYEIDFKETEGKAVISSITSAGLAKAGASRAIKFIPIIGTYLGGVATSVLSGASTYALGHAFMRHFDKGGTFLDIDLNSLKKMYTEKFEKGKQVAENFSKDQQAKEEILKEVEKKQEGIRYTDDVISKLKEIGELKEKGIITEDEFTKMKEKLLG